MILLNLTALVNTEEQTVFLHYFCQMFALHKIKEKKKHLQKYLLLFGENLSWTFSF